MAASITASDHDKIRQWIEERGGHPARAKDAELHDTVRIDFDKSDPVSWEELFRALDESRIEFLHSTTHRH